MHFCRGRACECSAYLPQQEMCDVDGAEHCLLHIGGDSHAEQPLLEDHVLPICCALLQTACLSPDQTKHAQSMT